MADEDITLDGQPLQSLRVADLKAALEQRNLPKSGQKNTLIKRLKGALMLENLQKSSSSHSGLQPNSQIGEEMSQNSFIKQYLAKQQELLRQRMEREALQGDGADESPAVQEEDEDQSEDNDSASYVSSKLPPIRTGRGGGGLMVGRGMMGHRSGAGDGPTLHHQESPEAPAARMSRGAFLQGHKEPPAPSPPRAVASLSMRVLGQPDLQGLPPAVPRPQEKESAAPNEPGSAHPVLHLSRSARVSAASLVQEESDEDDDDSEEDEEWGPGPAGVRKGNRAPPQPPQKPVAVPPAARSKRKLQAPQHIPPPQAHQSPMQLRHPTPPPSPPPDLFPLPDTPKQSPPDTVDKEGESSESACGPRAAVPPANLQRQTSDSSSRSSSPEPPAKTRPGPLSLLVHKMESEEADMGDGSEALPHKSDADRQQENREEEDRRRKKEGGKGPEEKDVREEREKKTQAASKAQDSGSSSDSDSKSNSSPSSSQSSSFAGDKAWVKKVDQRHEGGDEKRADLRNAEKDHLLKREVSEPSAAAVSEMDPDTESAAAQQPASRAEAVPGESHLEENTNTKAFAARKISLTSSKTSPTTEGGAGEPEPGAASGRKRRWGSSTAVTAKKPSISITTESLKSLIPDIKVGQEAVVELHPDELQLSGDEESLDGNRDDQDKGLKIRRTVTQVVSGDGQENGQRNDEGEKPEQEGQHRTPRDKRRSSLSEDGSEVQASVNVDGEAKKVTPSDSLVRRSICQQKSGVSVTIDDPVHAARLPSPPRGKLSAIIHVTNLVRPFTLGQLKELLGQTGSVQEEGFWIDKIKSHCYVTYASTEEAAATRNALHGVKWPQSNPKVLSVDFSDQDELDFHKGILKPELVQEEEHVPPPPAPPPRLPPLMPERDRERDRDRGGAGVRDLWAERQREMERRERARGEREWDRDKIREFARPEEDGRRSRSRERERRRRERAKSKERKSDKKEKAEEPPAKLLDDLFLKTKAAPCIYWLPLTDEQATQRLLERTERQKERERRLKEQQDKEEKQREEEKKERLRGREKDGGPTASSRPPDRDDDDDKDRGRNRDGDRRRDSGRQQGQPAAASRSRSNTRDRRH